MNIINIKALWVLCILLFLMACKKNGSGDSGNDSGQTFEPIGSSKHKPGLGVNGGIPEGTDLRLPPCVKIVKRPKLLFTPDKTKLYGSTRTFYVAMSFINTCCTKPEEVNLPPGLMLTSDTGEEQNGLLVENVFFTVPPVNCNSLPDTMTIYLAVSCLNEHDSPPIGGRLNEYNIAMNGYSNFKVTTDPNLLKFLSLLKDKPGLRIADFVTNYPVTPTTPLEKAYSEIQLALYEITDGNGLTADEVKKLSQVLQPFK